ncbi:hypothetical protein GCM10010401_16030 [Rarobacter faecitabidus]|uniref:beta-glucosidase n=1 Tax=Rarobacter faecitabidus TaxID=13243 RepID=A0A542ZXC5_RARFA|nr:glycoside hydrolase family 3 N-terminal domain-containing protein [Rarobacter faecitabidus]TQL64995.1 beta-glucosidase [Rarobacter faecitabidus]
MSTNAHPLSRGPAWSRRGLSRGLAFLAAGAVAVTGLAAPAQAAPGDSGLSDLALSGTATASRFQNNGDGSFPAELAIDGIGSEQPSTTSRWASGTDDDTDPNGTGGPVWFQVDLGAEADLDSVRLDWEASAAKAYTLSSAVSDPEEPESWTTQATVTDGMGGIVVHDIEGTHARYLRLEMTEQIPNDWEIEWGDGHTIHYYGYSLFSFEVWGVSDQTLVGFSSASSNVDAGTTASIPVRLSQTSATDTTVHVTSADGTAVAGQDYTAVDEDVTIPAGETTVNIESAIPADAASGTFTLTLSNPSTPTILGGTVTHTVNIADAPQPLPSTGKWVTFDDLEDGWPGFTYADGDAGDSVTLSSVPSDRPDAAEGSNAVSADVSSTSWSGLFWNFASQQNWKDYDALGLWFKGSDSGKNDLYLQIKTGPSAAESTWTTYEWHFADTDEWTRLVFDFDGWDNIQGAGASEQLPFNPKQVRGVTLSLGWWGDHVATIDDLELHELAGNIEDFDTDTADNDIVDEGTMPGIYPWGGDEPSYPTIAKVTDDRSGDADATNNVLAGTYEITSGSWGGLTQNFSAPQDWRLYKGIRFWWYSSMENNPASPTAGNDIKFEIRAGSTAAGTSTLFDTSFKDNWGKDAQGNPTRWKLVEIPFSAMRVRTDYQQNWYNGSGVETDATPNLAKGWGYSVTFPAGTAATGYKIDSIEAYGGATSADDIELTLSPAVTLVDAGDDAVVTIAATTTDGQPLAQDVEVNYNTVDGSAVEGTDYTAASGTVTFEAGSESGTTQTFTVETTESSAPSVAKSISVQLNSANASASGDGRIVINAHGFPYLNSSLSDEARASDLVGRMTNEEKIGQMAQAERLGLSTNSIADLYLGSVLSGGGSVPEDNTPSGWADMVDGYQREALSTRLQIPLIYGVDAVHGHSNVVGATILPHNIGLGATRDPQVIEDGMKVTAQEVRATGIPWTFAPTLAVSRDERWGRSYESFGEDPALVKTYAKQAVEGLQGTDPSDMSGANKVLATAKHWAGDGGTEYGTGTGSYKLDQGVTKASSLQEFLDLHASVYEPALKAGVASIMPSYSAVQIGSGTPVRMHVNKELNTDVLKGDMGFKGFLISDWEGIDKVAGLPVNLGGNGNAPGAYKKAAIDSVNAGMDMMMSPYNYATFIESIKQGLAENLVAQTRIDDAVTRILTQKFALGLFEQPFAERDNVDNVGSAANRSVARDAAAKSQVLLKNSGGALPLSASESIYVAGSSADNLGRQMGGWTITWQGGSGATTTGTTIGQAIKAVGGDNVTIASSNAVPSSTYDVGVVVVGEDPYAEGEGDVGNKPNISMELSASDKTAITNVAQKVDKLVVLVVSGRTQILDSAQFNGVDAIVASWLPGSEGEGVADVLFGTKPFTGSLPVTWPASTSQLPINVGDATYAPAYPFGWGLRTDTAKQRLQSLSGKVPTGAQQLLDSLLADSSLWAPSGAFQNQAAGLKAAQQLAALLAGDENVAAAATVASIATDAAASDYVAGDAKAFALAQRQIVSGEPAQAIVALASIAGTVLNPADSVPSANANLADLKVNGSIIEGFNSSVTSYSIELPKGASVPVVTATPSEVSAVVSVTAAAAVPGHTTVTVTAPNGTATKTYTVNFTVKDGGPDGPVAPKFTSPGKVTVNGVFRYGRTLTANLSGTTPSADLVTYEWLRGGKPISGATGAKYTLTKVDVGKKISVRATAHKTGYVKAQAVSAAKSVAKAKTTTTQKVKVKGKSVTVTVRVRTAATSAPTGKVVVTVGKKKKTVKLKAKKKGVVKVTFKRSKAGKYKVTSSYRATKVLGKSKAKKAVTARVR